VNGLNQIPVYVDAINLLVRMSTTDITQTVIVLTYSMVQDIL